MPLDKKIVYNLPAVTSVSPYVIIFHFPLWRSSSDALRNLCSTDFPPSAKLMNILQNFLSTDPSDLAKKTDPLKTRRNVIAKFKIGKAMSSNLETGNRNLQRAFSYIDLPDIAVSCSIVDADTDDKGEDPSATFCNAKCRIIMLWLIRLTLIFQFSFHYV